MSKETNKKCFDSGELFLADDYFAHEVLKEISKKILHNTIKMEEPMGMRSRFYISGLISSSLMAASIVESSQGEEDMGKLLDIFVEDIKKRIKVGKKYKEAIKTKKSKIINKNLRK